MKTIGGLLGVESSILRKIRHEEQTANDCLQEMLDEWLQMRNPAPTWKVLVDAVEVVDKGKAQEIQERIAR